MTTRRDFLGALPAIPAGLPLVSGSAGTLQGNQGASCDVLTFGATGDGTTDDTKAVKAGVEACPLNGRLVFPPARRYRLGRIEIRKNLVVDAVGATIMLAGPQAGFWVHGTIDFFRVFGGTIVGNGNPQDWQIAWLVGDLPDDEISNVVLDGVTAVDCVIGIKVAGRAEAPVRHLTLRDLRVMHSVGLDPGMGHGVVFHYADYGKVIGCHFENCERHALYFSLGHHYTAVGNTFTAHRSSVPERAFLAAFSISRCENVSAIGNIFDRCADGTLAIDTDVLGTVCRNVTVVGNTFENSGSFDVVIGNTDPAVQGVPRNVVLLGNAFLRDAATPAGTAIDVRSATHLTIADNTFFHEASAGTPTAILLRGAGGEEFTRFVAIRGNMFRGDTPDGRAYTVEMGTTISRGRSTVHIIGNVDHTSGGVRTEGKMTNRNLRIGP